MDLIKKEYADKAVEACVTSFRVEACVTEYQVLLTIKEPAMSFVEQLRNIQQVYQELVAEELPGDAVAVFRRYFLSTAGTLKWNEGSHVDLFADRDGRGESRKRIVESISWKLWPLLVGRRFQ